MYGMMVCHWKLYGGGTGQQVVDDVDGEISLTCPACCGSAVARLWLEKKKHRHIYT